MLLISTKRLELENKKKQINKLLSHEELEKILNENPDTVSLALISNTLGKIKKKGDQEQI